MRLDLDRERAVRAALRRLAQGTPEPPANARTEAAIFAAFDATWRRTGGNSAARRLNRAGRILTVAAIATAAIVVFSVSGHVPRMVRLKPDTTAAGVPVVRGTVQLKPDTTAAPIPSGSVRLQPDPTDFGSVRLQPDQPMPRPRRRAITQPPPVAHTDPSDFVPWPGSAALPPLESGAFVRIDLPVSVLPSLGMLPPPHAGVVQADVLVGQDGFARAIRLVPADQQRQ